MRDLYRRLGVRSDCSNPELWAAINACSHVQLKRDAAEALLKPERRRSYDKLRSTLVDIGILRGRLGLTHTDHWQGAIASDFSPKSGAPRSRRTEFLSKIEQINRGAKRRARLSRLTKAAVLFVVLGFFVWAFNQETNRTHVPSNRRPQTFVEEARGNPERLLETEEICEVQQLLSQEGFYEGAIDGQPGPETLAAITAFYALTQERYARQSNVQVNAALLSDVRRAISFSAPLFTKRPRNGALLEPPKAQALAPLSIKAPFGQEDY